MDDKLDVLFLWHMHQPDYRSTVDDHFLLPWTRLHATKDYLGFAKLLESIPGVRTNVNFTPVLWNQIFLYSQGIDDWEFVISRIATEKLSHSQKSYIIKNLFSGNYSTLIAPYMRYRELYRLAEVSNPDRDIDTIVRRFEIQDYRDLVTWRMLAWINNNIYPEFPLIQRLIEKGRGYTETEKNDLIQTIGELIKSIPERYKKLVESETIDITTTPYFHPILPLLLNPKSACEALPHITLPEHFSFPDDAQWHVREAKENYFELFSEIPVGMWPAEGAVSPQAAELFTSNGIKWIASDEDILARSAGINFVRDGTGLINRPDILYRPWRIETDSGSITISFRDHFLSDLLGFEYQKWETDKAVDDFISRLMKIRNVLASKPFKSCVTIILDGENAWEYYPEGGYPFLSQLFSRLTEHPELNLTRISRLLEDFDGKIPLLPRLASGSWINGNLGIWIGHPEENAAWRLIRKAYRLLESHKESIDSNMYAECKRYLRKAQSSDWFWWYGDDHFTPDKMVFDKLFRSNLENIYVKLGQPVPQELQQTLCKEKIRTFKLTHPRTLITPKIDGKVGSFYEWFGCGTLEYRQGFSAMHPSAPDVLFKNIKFGFDLQRFYLRLDPDSGFKNATLRTLRISIIRENGKRIHADIKLKGVLEDDGSFRITEVESCEHQSGIKAAFQDVLEISVPFKFFKVKRNDPLEVFLEFRIGDVLITRIPDLYGITFNVPTEDYDNLMWEV